MRRLWAGTATAFAIVMLTASPAAAKTKPPPADESAQAACQHLRLVQVNRQYGMDPSDTDYSLMIQALQESRSKGAAKLAAQLFKAPTPAAQESVEPAISHWCLDTLKIRCSAFQCVDGNRVTSIPKR